MIYLAAILTAAAVTVFFMWCGSLEAQDDEY